MSTLRLDPAVAAARRAARAASMPASKPIVAPTPPSTSPATGPNKHDRLKAELDALEQKLAACWPHLFTEPVPLKIGIGKEIARHLAPEERKVLKAFMQNWVKAPAYLHACTQPGAHRVDLAGNLSPISEKHRAHAAKVLSNEYTPQPVEVGKP